MYAHTSVCLHKKIAGWINQGPQPIALVQQEAWSKVSHSLVSLNTPPGLNFRLYKDYCSVAQRL